MSQKGTILTQLNLVVHDMEATLEFYRRPGVPIRPDAARASGGHHAEVELDNGFILEFDSIELAKHHNSAAATLKAPLPIGAGPIGTRMYYEVIGGEIVGDRLRGTLLGGGEWALIGSDGFLRVNVRLQVETHDGAHLYIRYTGLLELNEAVQGALASGAGTDFGEQYFFTNPRIETGDERSAWVNTTFFIGEGHILRGLGVEYRVWRPA